MSEFTVETYLQYSLCYTKVMWAAYAVYLVLCLAFHKTYLRSFWAAVVCFALLSEEWWRVSQMLGGALPESLKPPWLTLLMNTPFLVIIYEILFRKAGVSVLDAWKNGPAGRRGVKPDREPERVHSAVKRPARPASDHQFFD